MPLTITCHNPGCDKTFESFPCRQAIGRDRYCSRGCYVECRTHTNRQWGKGREAINTMSDVECAWLAALVDGEGCISLSNRGYGRLTVVNTCMGLLDRCVEIVGSGSITPRQLAKAHWKASWSWQVNGLGAVAVLEQIRPYLIAKADKADVLIKSPIYRSAA